MFTLKQNRCSHSAGMAVHDAPEYALGSVADAFNLMLDAFQQAVNDIRNASTTLSDVSQNTSDTV